MKGRHLGRVQEVERLLLHHFLPCISEMVWSLSLSLLILFLFFVFGLTSLGFVLGLVEGFGFAFRLDFFRVCLGRAWLLWGLFGLGLGFDFFRACFGLV